MKTLNLYVTRGFLLALAMAIGILTFGILTFGMTGANLVKVLEFVSQGIPLSVFCKFTLYILPIILTFTVPWAVMVAVMLVFGRMSADNEITAMRACGVSILQIMSPIMIITVLLTALCLYLQVEIGPPLLGKSRDLMGDAAINQPLAIFEPGKPIAYGFHDTGQAAFHGGDWSYPPQINSRLSVLIEETNKPLYTLCVVVVSFFFVVTLFTFEPKIVMVKRYIRIANVLFCQRPDMMDNVALLLAAYLTQSPVRRHTHCNV